MIRYILLAMIAMTPLQLQAQLTDVELKSVNIMADRSLTVPLSRLASDYSRENNITITVGFAPSFEQTIAIQEGESADLFITAHPESIKTLKQRGLFDAKSLKPLVKANLSLIYTGDLHELPNQADITKLMEKPISFIAIASPAATAEGFYAKQTLKSLKKKMVTPIAEMPDTESMLDLISKTKSDNILAIMFEPDALLNTGNEIAATVPKEWHEEAIFTSAIIIGESTEEARKFQKFLQSETAQREFIKYRFYPAINTEE